MSVHCLVEATVRLDEPTREKHLPTPLMYSNVEAHAMRLAVVNNDGTPADLTDVAASATFLRSDNSTVEPILGEITGNVVEVILPGSCYTVPGRFEFSLNLAYGTELRTAMFVTGFVKKATSEDIIDPGTPVGNIDQVVARAGAAATAAANAAASATSAAAAAQEVVDNVEDDIGDLKSKIDASGIITETSVSFPETNTYYGTNGKKNSNSASVGTGFVAVNHGDTIKFKLAEHTSFATIAFYTAEDQNTFINGSAVIGSSSTLAYVESSVNVPSTAKYMRAGSWDATEDCYLKIVSVIDVNALNDSVEQNTEDIASLETDVDAVEASVSIKMGMTIDISKPFPNQGYLNLQGKITGQSYTTYVTDFIPIEESVSSIKYNLAKVTSALMIAFYTDADQNTYIAGSGIEGEGANLDMNEGETTVPSGARYFRAGQWEVSGANYYVKKVYTLNNVIGSLHDVTEKEIADAGDIDTAMLMESINKPFVFASKKVTAFGDSITIGVASPGLTSTTPYIRLFTDHVGATLNNKAISGSCIGGTGNSSIKNKVLAYSESTDFIVIAGGTNDYNSGITLGTFGSVDSTDFYGALEAICTYLQTNYSSTPVIFITPIPYTNKAATLKNSVGKTLNDYRRAIYEVATKYGHSVVDGTSLGMPTSQGGWGNLMCDDTDGCHPTADGHKLMARSLAGKLC